MDSTGRTAQKPGWVSRKTTGKPRTFDPDLQRGTLAGSRKAIRRNIPEEEQIGRLNDLLKPISSGKLVTKEIALWQSFWWFVPIVLILGLELFLRKRAGML